MARVALAFQSSAHTLHTVAVHSVDSNRGCSASASTGVGTSAMKRLFGAGASGAGPSTPVKPPAVSQES